MKAKDKVVKSGKIAVLQVRGYDSELQLPLPTVYSQQMMPANRSHIPTPETALKWPHLKKKITGKLMPLTECEIGLLIGYNYSRALAPREVNLPDSESYGPFGQKTDLGWGIAGIVDHSDIDKEGRDPISVSHHVVTCERPPSLSKAADSHIFFRSSVKEIINPYQVCQMMVLDFSEKTNDQRTLSQEDRQFMNIVHDGIHLREDHHYEMPVLFKECQVTK